MRVKVRAAAGQITTEANLNFQRALMLFIGEPIRKKLSAYFFPLQVIVIKWIRNSI